MDRLRPRPGEARVTVTLVERKPPLNMLGIDLKVDDESRQIVLTFDEESFERLKQAYGSDLEKDGIRLDITVP